MRVAWDGGLDWGTRLTSECEQDRGLAGRHTRRRRHMGLGVRLSDPEEECKVWREGRMSLGGGDGHDGVA